MGATAAIKLRQVAENLETILALELFCAAQGVDFRKRSGGSKTNLGVGTRGLYAEIRQSVPFIETDEYMKRHIDKMISIVREWRLQ